MAKAKKENNSRGVYQRGSVWWIRYRYNGQLIRQSIGYDRRLAEETLCAIKGDIVRGEHRLKRNGDKRLFKEMVEEYLKEKVKRSLDRDKESFKNLSPEFQHKALHTITREDVEGYIRKRKTKVSNTTVNRELALLSHMFNIAIEKGYCDRNPVKGIKRLKESPWRHRFVFSEIEIRQLVENSCPHLRLILMLAFGTGLRKGDLLNLQWEDVDFDHGIITCTMQKTEAPVEIPMLPMIQRTLERIKATTNGSPYVFTLNGQKIGDIKTAFNAALRRSGLDKKGYHFHDIRRTFATMLYNRGVHLTKIQRLLGHKSVLTTERYLGVKFEETRQAMKAIDRPLAKALIMPDVCTTSAQLPERVHEKALLSVN
jgi:integrase